MEQANARVSSASSFDYAGLATLGDLDDPAYRQTYALLEQLQAEFLAHERQFRSPGYKWPRDALHNWSRIWEYPYAYHHLKQMVEARAGGPVRIADIGSGVTFFPFAVARLGTHVTCSDIDPLCGRDLARASAVVSTAPGIVDFRLAAMNSLPFETGEVDLAYCISVIEHVPDIEAMVQELARIIRPGGELLLTIDIDLRGDSEIGPSGHRRLLRALGNAFDTELPFRCHHPAELLTTANSPCTQWRRSGLQHGADFIKQWVIKPLLGRRPRRSLPFHLAVEAHRLRRRDEASAAGHA